MKGTEGQKRRRKTLQVERILNCLLVWFVEVEKAIKLFPIQ